MFYLLNSSPAEIFKCYCVGSDCCLGDVGSRGGGYYRIDTLWRFSSREGGFGVGRFSWNLHLILVPLWIVMWCQEICRIFGGFEIYHAVVS